MPRYCGTAQRTGQIHQLKQGEVEGDCDEPCEGRLVGVGCMLVVKAATHCAFSVSITCHSVHSVPCCWLVSHLVCCEVVFGGVQQLRVVCVYFGVLALHCSNFTSLVLLHTLCLLLWA